jgi:hypothetical protein
VSLTHYPSQCFAILMFPHWLYKHHYYVVLKTNNTIQPKFSPIHLAMMVLVVFTHGCSYFQLFFPCNHMLWSSSLFKKWKSIEPLLLLSTHSTLSSVLLVKVQTQQTLHKLNIKNFKSLTKTCAKHPKKKRKAHTTFTHRLKSSHNFHT